MDRNENTTDYDGGNGESPSILIGIIGAIILGVIIGGFAPGFAKHFSVLGEIFLNSLKMIVVPLSSALQDWVILEILERLAVVLYFITW